MRASNPATTSSTAQKHHSGEWGKTAKNIELYNSAYRLAWKHISELQKREQPDIALRLHDSIRRQLKGGATEPLFMASEALTDVEKSD